MSSTVDVAPLLRLNAIVPRTMTKPTDKPAINGKLEPMNS